MEKYVSHCVVCSSLIDDAHGTDFAVDVLEKSPLTWVRYHCTHASAKIIGSYVKCSLGMYHL